MQSEQLTAARSGVRISLDSSVQPAVQLSGRIRPKRCIGRCGPRSCMNKLELGRCRCRDGPGRAGEREGRTGPMLRRYSFKVRRHPQRRPPLLTGRRRRPRLPYVGGGGGESRTLRRACVRRRRCQGPTSARAMTEPGRLTPRSIFCESLTTEVDFYGASARLVCRFTAVRQRSSYFVGLFITYRR